MENHAKQRGPAAAMAIHLPNHGENNLLPKQHEGSRLAFRAWRIFDHASLCCIPDLLSELHVTVPWIGVNGAFLDMST
jgi:hypothetical protein